MLDKKIRLLVDVLGNFKKQGSEFLFFCPKCKHHKQKLSVNISKNAFKCWVCGWSGKKISSLIWKQGGAANFHKWQELSGVIDLAYDEEEKKEIEISLPPDFQLLWNNKSLNAQRARSYLFKERNLTEQDLMWWKIGYSLKGDFHHRVIIPSFDNDGELDFFVARNYLNNFVSYLNPPKTKDIIFNELFIDWKEDIIITEGVFDAIIAGNAIPLLGSSLMENSYIFQTIVKNKDTVYVALDKDARNRQIQIMDLFLAYGLTVFDVRVAPFKDVGEMTQATFQRKKREATIFDWDAKFQEKMEKAIK